MGTDISICTEKRSAAGKPWRMFTPSVQYSDRNYDLFAMLAGVCNRGCFVPISEPRGWPDGHNESDEDRFGASFLTLRDLLAHDWGQKVTSRFGHNEQTHGECAGRFFSEFLPALSKYGDPENVRIVFDFGC